MHQQHLLRASVDTDLNMLNHVRIELQTEKQDSLAGVPLLIYMLL